MLCDSLSAQPDFLQGTQVSSKNRHNKLKLRMFSFRNECFSSDHSDVLVGESDFQFCYQTPDVEHEGNWWEIAGLAYFQLWMARPLAESTPHPWERYAQPPSENPRSLGPSEVQKDFERIIRQYELTLPPPKPRGKSPGRVHDYSPGHRKPPPHRV